MEDREVREMWGRYRRVEKESDALTQGGAPKWDPVVSRVEDREVREMWKRYRRVEKESDALTQGGGAQMGPSSQSGGRPRGQRDVGEDKRGWGRIVMIIHHVVTQGDGWRRRAIH